jgi:hypothetical protein
VTPRFPTLELAVGLEARELQADLLTGGLTALPITWSADTPQCTVPA